MAETRRRFPNDPDVATVFIRSQLEALDAEEAEEAEENQAGLIGNESNNFREVNADTELARTSKANEGLVTTSGHMPVTFMAGTTTASEAQVAMLVEAAALEVRAAAKAAATARRTAVEARLVRVAEQGLALCPNHAGLLLALHALCRRLAAVSRAHQLRSPSNVTTECARGDSSRQNEFEDGLGIAWSVRRAREVRTSLKLLAPDAHLLLAPPSAFNPPR
jgi:hypothetical protein